MQALSHLGSVVAAFGFAVGITVSFALLGQCVRLVSPNIGFSSSVNTLWDVFIGTTAAAFLTTVLGMLGFFNPLAFASVLAAGPLLSLFNGGAFIALWSAIRELVSLLREQRLLGTVLIIPSAIVIVLTAVPEIFYDALYYHLGLPWQYLIAGEIRWRPSVVHSAFPAYLDVLFGMCLGLAGVAAAKFFNLLLFILGWCATAALVYEVMGDKRAALVSAITVSTIPGVVIMSTMCGIDAALIGFAAMSGIALARMRRSEPEDLRRLTILAAVCAGFVAGSKYTGLWLIGSLALFIVTSHRSRLAARLVVLFVGTAILIAAPWYVRNMVSIGDPIYPVLSGILMNGDARWAVERIERDVPTAGISWASLQELAIGLAYNSNRFGAGSEIGLLLPVGIVALLLGALRVLHLRPWAVVVAAYVTVWLMQSNVVRYLYPIFPFSALGIAWVTCGALERWRRPAIGTAAFVVLALVPLSQSIRVLDSLYNGRDVAALFSGAMAKEDYLARRLAYYPAAQWLNSHASPDAQVLYLGETRLLYLDRPVSFSSAYDFTEIAHLLTPNNPPFFTQLRSRGITHIMINGREIERLRTSYQYLTLSGDAERRLRGALAKCLIVFQKSGVQVCELPQGRN